MRPTLFKLLAWFFLAFICFVALGPITLRPETGQVALERFAAFACLGLLFTLVYPSHFARSIVLVVIAAIALESLQHLTPDRHGHLQDAAVKVAGAIVGCCVASVALRVWNRAKTA